MASLLESVQEIYAAFGRGDVPTILAALDEHVAWEVWDDNSAANAGVPWMQPRQGRDGAAEFFAVLAGTLRIREFRVLSIMAGPSSVAAELRLEAEVIATGVVYRDEEMHLWSFDEAGKVTRLRHYLDTAKHIAAAQAGTDPRLR